MNQNEIDEILRYINAKYHERVPGVVRSLVKGKIRKIQEYESEEMPEPLRRCTVEELLLIVQRGLKENKISL